jgi:hypothetical protein
MLLAHELTHVVQQRGNGAAPGGPIPIGPRESSAEAEARDHAEQLPSGEPQAAVAVSSGPQVQRDPPDGGAPPPAAPAPAAPQAVARGKWGFTQTNQDGKDARSLYKSHVDIVFMPEATAVNCGAIAFVQGGKVINAATGTSREPRAGAKERLTPGGWAIDRNDTEKSGWYGYRNDGSPAGFVRPGSSPPALGASMIDEPMWTVPNLHWNFETCAICKAGKDQSTVYGCLTWGFDVDAENKLTPHQKAELAGPSGDFKAALDAWNKQAAGPAEKRNAPDQETLGPFK